jgi:hypothetical protein
MNYYIHYWTDDSSGVDIVTKEELLTRIKLDKYGTTYYGQRPRFLSEFPTGVHVSYFPTLMIVKGEVVVPREVKTVTEYELP